MAKSVMRIISLFTSLTRTTANKQGTLFSLPRLLSTEKYLAKEVSLNGHTDILTTEVNKLTDCGGTSSTNEWYNTKSNG